ncbi:DNA-binding protein WhiA [Mycoplasmopsis caviae]|uniref:DNA-binding protein WhiA n=1 Tax=Mycoplasmopsis caviae TaxID=55603 RepID=A0A3P8LBC3_9BACT|nr:DNA-binding protein WhiA [Mycoplasmopsis caviae]UUD34791.1 DNA-binding protein WhiA [Mycoplasmopsis caviae]VDR42351.1 Uncharacterized protein conserved in bacteria [Mycoplasmopsis caviae]
MNFTYFVKNEIINRKKNDVESLEYLRGLIFGNGLIKNESILLNIRNQEFFDLIVALIKRLNLHYEIKNSRTLILNKCDIDLDVEFIKPSLFFAGVFQAGGSISNLGKTSYHMQLSSNYEQFIDIIMNKLNEYYFNFQKIKHQNKYIIYVKQKEKIEDFLKAILALESFYKFTDITIKRDFENSFNRINNIDIYNIKKAVNANVKHVENLNYLFNNNLLNHFSNEQISVYKILLSNPETPLSNISLLLEKEQNLIKSKSTIHHWLTKARNIVIKHKKGEI